MNVTDNHFPRDLFQLDKKRSCFQIATELSFQDRKFVLDNLPSPVSDIIELLRHFLTISSTNDLVVPGTDWNDLIGVQILSDLTMNRFRVVSAIHNIALRTSYLMTLSE